MRLAVIFVAIVAGISFAAAGVNYAVDPGSEFYDHEAFLASARDGCLLADDLVGGAGYRAFKGDVLRRVRPRTVVLGSSRVLKIASHPDERRFANLGMPLIGTRQLGELADDLARTAGSHPLTVYLGVEFMWFNPDPPRVLADPPFEQSFFEKVTYLLSRDNLRRSARMIVDNRSVAFGGWREERIGNYCVIDRTFPFVAWRLDGSRLYSFELDPNQPPLYQEPFSRDLRQIRAAQYWGFGGQFAWDRLRALERTLDQMRRRGWHVVGFAPPDAPRYVRLFASDPTTAAPWRTFARELPRAFRSRGFPYLDLRENRAIPCPESDFVDSGWHTDARCSARIRRRLDAAASRRWPAG